MALGVRYLAHLNSAWVAVAPAAAPTTFDSADMSALYCKDSFLKSYTLAEIGGVLEGQTGTGGGAAKKTATKKKAAKKKG